MATTVVTGRDLHLTIATVDYDPQVTSATLSNEHTIETFQTLDGRAYKAVDDRWSFAVEMLSDWGAASSLCEAMWTACESAPNTTLAVSLTAATGAVWAFNVLPIFPSAGGAAPGAQTQSWTFQVVGMPTETFS